MATFTDTAICIRRWDFSETSQTVSLFTRGCGIIRGIAKGAKRERGTFSGGLDVLTRGQIVGVVKPGRELATLTAWHLEETYRAVRQRLGANRAGLYVADLVHHMLTDHDPHPELFDDLGDTLVRIGRDPDPGPALLRFQWRLLEEAGYRPRLEAEGGDDGVETLAFSARAGGVVAQPEGPDCWRVRRGTIELLRALAAGACPEGDAATVDRANRLLAVYVRALIGKETSAMRWAFSDLGA
jgi:DNA repair protein RecO (recombination protein O)